MSLLSPGSTHDPEKHPRNLGDFQSKIANILALDWTRLPEAEKNACKIQWIGHIYDVLESETILPVEKLTFFTHFIEHLIRALPHDSQQIITKLRQVNKELDIHQKTLNEKMGYSHQPEDDLDDDMLHFPVMKDDELFELDDKMGVLSEKREKYLQNPDIQFLDRLFTAQEILAKKIAEYTQFLCDPKGTLLPEQLRGITNKKYICSNLGVFFLISEKDAPTIFGPDGVGVHFRDSIFSAIRATKDKEALQETIYHENLHNLYEIFFDSASPANMIRDRIGRLMLFVEKHAPQSIIDKERSLIEQSAETYVHNSKHEIIANFNELQEGIMATELTTYVDILRELQRQRAKNRTNVEFCRLLQESEDRLILSFKTYYNLLSDLIFVAKQTDVTKELRSGMILFKPNQYPTDLKNHMMQLVGKNRYDFYVALRQHIQNPFFTQKSPVSFHKKVHLSPEEKLLNALFGGKTPTTIDPVLVEAERPRLTKSHLSNLMSIGSDYIPLSEDLNKKFSSYLQNLDWQEISIDDLSLDNQEEKDDYIRTLSLFCQKFQLSVDIETIRQQIEL